MTAMYRLAQLRYRPSMAELFGKTSCMNAVTDKNGVLECLQSIGFTATLRQIESHYQPRV